MKKLRWLPCVVLSLALLLGGCAAKEEGPFQTSLSVNGQTLSLGGTLDEETAHAVGTPTDTVQAVSCHYDGNDTIYYYDTFALYTYRSGEKDILYSVELTDQSLQTAEGAHVGMTRAQVEAIYGNEYTDEQNRFSYEHSVYKLTFFLSGDTVNSIEYYMS